MKKLRNLRRRYALAFTDEDNIVHIVSREAFPFEEAQQRFRFRLLAGEAAGFKMKLHCVFGNDWAVSDRDVEAYNKAVMKDLPRVQ